MAKEKSAPKGAPPVIPKSKSIEHLERGQRANTGGDFYDRARGDYSKNPPVREEDPFSPFDNY